MARNLIHHNHAKICPLYCTISSLKPSKNITHLTTLNTFPFVKFRFTSHKHHLAWNRSTIVLSSYSISYSYPTFSSKDSKIQIPQANKLHVTMTSLHVYSYYTTTAHIPSTIRHHIRNVWKRNRVSSAPRDKYRQSGIR